MLHRDITILHREPAVHISTSFNEIVTCRFTDGSVRRLLLKRGVSHSDRSHGHHGGVPYEAIVYRSALEPLRTSAPRCHDAEVDPATGETVLLIDFIENARWLSKASRSSLFDAARWIGTFHRLNESRVGAFDVAITRYDAPYYLGWMRRTLDFWADQQGVWLAALAGRWPDFVRELLAAPQTLVHGEYYPKNILVHDNVIVPVDWETAAVGPGEIDLVALSERWAPTIQEDCGIAYRRARWPDGAPATSSRIQILAEIYLQLRWLGQRRDLLSSKEASDRLGRLRRLSVQTGVVGE
jgi:hypothetical protein